LSPKRDRAVQNVVADQVPLMSDIPANGGAKSNVGGRPRWVQAVCGKEAKA
jgi:hypothetical protein